jgi:phosphatidylserine decarboxylase|tara:strand:+ start:200 stop:397 length:198 start_codon:yes stop_codon:yes gene_type:complete
MHDPETIQSLIHYIRKRIDDTKDHIVYGVDNLEQLQYAKGKIGALEALLQDLKDLQKKGELVDDE